MYADYDKVDHRTRNVAYARAMEQLLRCPTHDEAQIHYALALNTSASPADKTYANQLKGGAAGAELPSGSQTILAWRILPDDPSRLLRDR